MAEFPHMLGAEGNREGRMEARQGLEPGRLLLMLGCQAEPHFLCQTVTYKAFYL